jgi:hypothetical protein
VDQQVLEPEPDAIAARLIASSRELIAISKEVISESRRLCALSRRTRQHPGSDQGHSPLFTVP